MGISKFCKCFKSTIRQEPSLNNFRNFILCLTAKFEFLLNHKITEYLKSLACCYNREILCLKIILSRTCFDLQLTSTIGTKINFSIFKFHCIRKNFTTMSTSNNTFFQSKTNTINDIFNSPLTMFLSKFR